jgi:hypothetical protein
MHHPGKIRQTVGCTLGRGRQRRLVTGYQLDAGGSAV